MSVTRVTVIDQHAMFTECLNLVLSIRGYDCRVVPVPEHPATTAGLLSSVLSLKSDVVVTNATFGDDDGTSLIEPIARTGARVVVVTEITDPARWGGCLLLGARAVIPKTALLSTLVSTIRRVGDGLPGTTAEERERLIGAHRNGNLRLREARERFRRLSTQEGEVLRHLMRGHAVREVAHLRVVSEATVRTQVKSILGKLEVSSQLAAVAIGHQVRSDGPELLAG